MAVEKQMTPADFDVEETDEVEIQVVNPEAVSIEADGEEVIIDFYESRVVDMSAIEALNKITERYKKAGKKVHLKHLSPDCRTLLSNADEIIDVNVVEDPTYKVMF